MIIYPYLEQHSSMLGLWGNISRLVAFARVCAILSHYVYRHDLLAKYLVAQSYIYMCVLLIVTNIQ